MICILDRICPRRLRIIAAIMGYLIEIDDLRKHIRFPVSEPDAPDFQDEMSKASEVPDGKPPTSIQPEFGFLTNRTRQKKRAIHE